MKWRNWGYVAFLIFVVITVTGPIVSSIASEWPSQSDVRRAEEMNPGKTVYIKDHKCYAQREDKPQKYVSMDGSVKTGLGTIYFNCPFKPDVWMDFK